MIAAIGLIPGEAAAQRLSFIRDAEIENTIRAFAAPLFRAAGLDPAVIGVHLVNDKSLNAFVAGGLNLFINTGLLIRSEHAGQVIGVIAHETGHISGGHLSRTQEALRNATTESILAVVLGVAAGIVSGRGDVGAAIITGGAQVGQRSILQYSREQESAADQAGIAFLENTSQSPLGLLEFLGVLQDQELLNVGRQDPYVRTHPITSERVSSARAALARSRFAQTRISPEFETMHRRMRAKLIGFMDPDRALIEFKESDISVEARYARAIALYKKPDLARALPLVDGLIASSPNDPYFHELKGQILFENGRTAEALGSYERAVALLPDQPLLRTSLAQVQLEMNNPALIKPALDNLNRAVAVDRRNGLTWQLLAVAHGREGQTGMLALALAERAQLQGNKSEARQQADRAERLLPQGSPGWLRAQDIKVESEKKD